MKGTSQIDIWWTQAGIISNYTIKVVNEEFNNYSVSWSSSGNGNYSATIANLSVPGKFYYINLTAISEYQASETVTTSAVTRKILIHDHIG